MQKIHLKKIKNYLNQNEVKFFCRENSSDEKAFLDVFKTKCYHFDPIFKTEQYKKSWLDLGGNAGAFALLVGNECEKITVYDPIPANCDLIKRNCDLNKINAEIICAAASPDDGKKAKFHIRNDDQNWRSSLYAPLVKGKTKQIIAVDLVLPKQNCKNLKMDIEGGEYDLMDHNFVNQFDSFVLEYGFEIDKNMKNFRNRIDNLKNDFLISGHEFAYDVKHQLWPNGWFPAAKIIKGVRI